MAKNQIKGSVKIQVIFALILFSLFLSTNVLAAQDFIIENKTSALFIGLILLFGLVFIKNIKEKNGSHNKIIVSVRPFGCPRPLQSIDSNIYKPFGSVSPKGHRQGRITRLLRKVQDLLAVHSLAGSNSFRKGLEFPSLPSKGSRDLLTRISLALFALTFLSIFLSTTTFAAQDFIIENKTAALFVVNGTTGNIIMAPSFGLVGIRDLK